MVIPAEKKAAWGPGRRLCVDLSEILFAISEGRRSPEQVAKQLRKIADFADGIAPAKSAKPAVDTTSEESEIFAYWRVVTGKSGSQFTAERRAKVRTRLREGYSVAKIKQAIDYVCNDPWYSGANPNGKKYVDLELICRSATQLEKFIESAEDSGIKASNPVESMEKSEALKRAQEDAADALRNGDNDGYSRAQARIKNLKRG